MALPTSIQEKLTTIAENEQRVYDAGHTEGVKSEYDRFWDAYQNNGKGMLWGTQAFACTFWNDDNFYPKYDIVPYQSSTDYFYTNGVTNLRERIDGRGLKLDLSKTTSVQQFFRESKTSEVPDMDTSHCKSFIRAFYNTKKLHTIPRLNMTSATSVVDAFYQATALQNITFEGTIPVSVSFAQSSLLTIESLRSIISALYDFVGNGETTTRTLTLHADAKAKLTEDDVKAITDKGWTLV